MLLSRDWGLVIIEVKSFSIEQLQGIQHPRWIMASSFYKPYLEPFKQAEHQLRQIYKQINRRETLSKRILGRVLVALPLITRDQWQLRVEDHSSPQIPPLLFANELGKATLRKTLEHKGIILEEGSGQPLTPEQWYQICNLLQGPKLLPPIPTSPKPQNRIPTRKDVLHQLKTWVFTADHQQAKIGLQIPPGPQRIRGIAGSGKTLLLCQKAAQMHLQHPEWKIALVFFTP